MGFDIEGFKPLIWSPDDISAMSQLILPLRDIEIIKALSAKHAVENTTRWGADFIPGKGEGQVFLLHGMSYLLCILITGLMRLFRSSRYWEDVHSR